LFAPRRWAETATALDEQLGDLTDRLRAGQEDLVADAFVAGAAVLVHVRADPLLPAQLLPTAWPGPTLRATYRRFRDTYAATARSWFRRDEVAP
jgi:phenylacetic acid degradation operon negative regulatory protein